MTSASDTEPGDVVLVTGGAGFLGQHIIRVLQERGDDVREIRVLDRIPYENKLSTQNVCNEFWLNMNYCLIDRFCKIHKSLIYLPLCAENSLESDIEFSAYA